MAGLQDLRNAGFVAQPAEQETDAGWRGVYGPDLNADARRLEELFDRQCLKSPSNFKEQFHSIVNQDPALTGVIAEDIFTSDRPQAKRISFLREGLDSGSEPVVKMGAKWLNDLCRESGNLERIFALHGAELFDKHGRLGDVAEGVATMLISEKLPVESRLEFTGLAARMPAETLNAVIDILKAGEKVSENSKMLAALVVSCGRNSDTAQSLTGAVTSMLSKPDLGYQEAVSLCSGYLEMNGADQLKDLVKSGKLTGEHVLAAGAVLKKHIS